MRYDELPDGPKPGVVLYCAECDTRCSARRSEYFLLSPDAIIMCCGDEMVLVEEHTTLREVKL